VTKTALESAKPVGEWLDAADVDNLEKVFKALADGFRILMLNSLAREEYVSVSEFAAHLGLSQSRTSYHVKQLVEAGLIRGERNGNFVWYSLVDGALERVAALFAADSG
jgi:ArsR family transcriptional regulator